jgi:hypothetical protein
MQGSNVRACIFCSVDYLIIQYKPQSCLKYVLGLAALLLVQEYAARKVLLDAHAARQSTTVRCFLMTFQLPA